jgi:hypothetical protein
MHDTEEQAEEYVQPLYGFSPILPNGNGIAVLLERRLQKSSLADLGEYERKSKSVFVC